MKKIESENLIETIIVETKQSIETVNSEFATLSDEILYTKPNKKAWNIIECLQHIIIANNHYYNEIDKQLKATNTISVDQFKSGLLGNYFTKSMKPKPSGVIPSKMKTFKKFIPIGSTDRSAIEKFVEEQNKFLDLLECAKNANLEKVKIKSAIGGWLMFKLGDAFRFVTAHTQRHILQAQNVLKGI